MKVQDVMTRDVNFCCPETSVAAVATMMFERDCGACPVVNNENKVIGMITDRDIAIATGTRGLPAWEIPVSEVISGSLYSTTRDEDIRAALKTMRHARVRRLPVINAAGSLEGFLSLNDIVLRAEEEKARHHPELSYEDAMSTFKAVCEHRPLHFAGVA